MPHWVETGGKKHLVIPYSLDTNYVHFKLPSGFSGATQFYEYVCDSINYLYKEGSHQPKMMNIGLHPRLIGRPGRIQSLKKFLNYVAKFKDIWICKRVDIAKHWIKNYSL